MNTLEHPPVTVILPVYNGDKFLTKSLESLSTMDYPNYIILISDNASTDNTEKICAAFAEKDQRILYSRNETNWGPYKNVQKLEQMCSTPYIMVASDHDLWHPSYISRLMEVLTKDESVMLAYPRTTIIDIHDNIIEKAPDILDTRGLDRIRRFSKIIWEFTWGNMNFGIFRTDAYRHSIKTERNVIGCDHVQMALLSLEGSIAQVDDFLFYRRDNRPGEDNIKRQIDWYMKSKIKALTPWTMLAFEQIKVVREAGLSETEKELLLEDIINCYRSRFGNGIRKEALDLAENSQRIFSNQEIPPSLRVDMALDLLETAGICRYFSPEISELESVSAFAMKHIASRQPVIRPDEALYKSETSKEAVDTPATASSVTPGSLTGGTSWTLPQGKIKLYAGDIPEKPQYEGWIGLSLTRENHRHFRHDITRPFLITDNSVDSFQAEDVFEHIAYDTLVPILNEIHRVLKPGGLFRLSVPDYRCDILFERSVKDDQGNIIFDPMGGGTPKAPGHVWFPRYETVKTAVEASAFGTAGRIEFLHYYREDGTQVTHPIDYTLGHVQRTPDFDSRVQNPYRPMSIVVDLTKTEEFRKINSDAVTEVKQPVRLSFAMIVLNGMPFVEYALKAIYDEAQEIIIVEGAVENCAFAANQDGSSVDGTVECIKCFPDPHRKIKLIQGKWPEKCEMQNAALAHVTGNYVWLVDSDEIYKREDLGRIRSLLASDPDITQINFIPDNFWKGFDYLFVSPHFFEPANHYRRLFKFKPGSRFTTHRPPTMLWPESDKTTEEMHLIDGHATRQMGIIPFHYSYVLDSQVHQKLELYRRYGWGNNWGIDLEKWYSEFFLQWEPEKSRELERRYPIWTGDANSYSIPFSGTHPEVMTDLIRDYRNGEFPSRTENKQKTAYVIDEQDALVTAGAVKYQRQVLDAWSHIELDEPLRIRKESMEQYIKSGSPFWNIHVALAFVASRLKPRSYLEIGVRTGASMAQVLHNAKPDRVTGVDLWSGEYSSLPNNRIFTEGQLARFQRETGRYTASIELIQGNSHIILKALISNGLKYDLITVDGDHSDQGAMEDLEDAYQLLNDRGVIVFDDIIHPSFKSLLDVIYEFTRRHSDLRLVLNTRQDNGVALLLRGIEWNHLKGYRIAGEAASGNDLTQIQEGSDFESMLRELVHSIKPRKIIETGTYLGNGTTRIIAAALREKKLTDTTFYTIECNPGNYQQAMVNLTSLGLIGYVHMLLGLSVPRNMLPDIREIEEQYVNNIEFNDVFVDHQEDERALLYFKETDFTDVEDDMLGKALDNCGDKPDFVLLDSGGHMGNIEFTYLISRIKAPCYIALDDIFHIKHHKSFKQMQNDEQFEILNVSEEKFGFCFAKFTPKRLKGRDEIERLIWLRTDSIGDNILAASMLPHVREKYANAHITVVCQEHIAEYYDACPYVDNILSFDRRKALSDKAYLDNLLSRIKNIRADLLLNSVYSREPLTDFLALGCEARWTVALEGDLCNMTNEVRERHNRIYSQVIVSKGEWKGELERHRDFLAGIDIEAGNLTPTAWVSPKDNAWAESLFNSNGLDPERTIVLFAGAQHAMRLYERYGNALNEVCKDNNFSIIALGREEDGPITLINLENCGACYVNLCGQTTIRQSAALINLCRLAVGAETGLAHLACAMNTPNVVLLGGGHFGRFMPYSRLTTIACLPLNCYGCNWNCRYSRSHCVADLKPYVLEQAITSALSGSNNTCRVIAQPEQDWLSDVTLPSWRDCSDYLPDQPVEMSLARKADDPLTGYNKREYRHLVSAIVSTYKSEKFIRGCLEDLVRQTLFMAGKLEIIVIDSGSPENEKSILKEYQNKYPDNIIYIRTPDRETIYQAWNRGIHAASGKYLTNANTDDRHRYDALEIMAKTLDDNHDVALVYADQKITNIPNQTFDNCTPSGYFAWPEFDRTQLIHCSCIGPQPMWRKDLHIVLGLFNETLEVAGDYDWWLRLSKHYRFLHIPELLGLYYLNLKGMEYSNQSKCEDETEIIRQKAIEESGITLNFNRYKASFLSTNHSSAADSEDTNEQFMVSVIVPTFNRPDFLKTALTSILNQTMQSYEIIVVNDAGNDALSVLAEFKGRGNIIHIAHDTNQGLAAARNTGIRMARGKYIAYLDDDDIYYPNHLEILSNFLNQGEFKVAYTDAFRATLQKEGEQYITVRKEKIYSSDFDNNRILIDNFIPVLCVMHEKSCIYETGLFDESLMTHEDWDMWIRMSRKFAFHHIAKTTCEFTYRADGNSTTGGKLPLFLKSYKTIYDKYRHSAGSVSGVIEEQERNLFHAYLRAYDFLGKRTQSLLAKSNSAEDLTGYLVKELLKTGATEEQILSTIYWQSGLKSNSPDSALKNFENALRYDSSNYHAKLDSIRAYMMLGDGKMAEEGLATLMRICPNDAALQKTLDDIRQTFHK